MEQSKKEEIRKEWLDVYHNSPKEASSKTAFDFFFKIIESQEEDNKKFKELEIEITRLQEKYDENGYDANSIIKLSRMEDHIDSSFREYVAQKKKLDRENSSLKE